MVYSSEGEGEEEEEEDPCMKFLHRIVYSFALLTRNE